jgi:hypothetical protein
MEDYLFQIQIVLAGICWIAIVIYVINEIKKKWK